MSVNDFIKTAAKTLSKANDVLEVNIEDRFVKYAKRNNCIAYKLIILNRRGWPDRSVLCPGGILFFIEFKRPGVNKISPTQSSVRKTIERLGFKYYVCNKDGQAEALLDKHLNQ